MSTRRAGRRRDAVVIAVASLVLGIGTTAALGAVASSGYSSWAGEPQLSGPLPTQPVTCTAPSMPGTEVDVDLTDMGAMMGPGGMMGPGMMSDRQFRDGSQWPGMATMRMVLDSPTVPAGEVSLVVFNRGFMAHEAVVMPLDADQVPGDRPIGPDGKVDETGNLGEASRTCGAGDGDGIASGASGWTTLTLAPGRYEVLCNIAGHYGRGMNAELDVAPRR